MIEAKNVDFYYGDFHALENISMTMESNTVTAFIGPSGDVIRAMGNSKEGKPSKPYIDPYFARNYAECTRLGIPVGVYGYFKATTKAQADRELALFKQALGGKTFQLPVAVDIEDKLQEALSKAALTDIVTHCLSVVESWGVYAMLYTGLWGSPPHVRGKGASWYTPTMTAGITLAYAGKSLREAGWIC